MGHEKSMTTILPALAGASTIYGMGMLEMGISIGYDQMVYDTEIIRMAKRALRGMDVNEDTLAEEVIKKIGPAGTYLAEKHTRDFMRSEGSQATLFDRTMYETWTKHGSKDVREKAKEEARRRLSEHVVPPLEPQVSSELKSIIAEIEEEIKEKRFNK